MTSWWNRGKAIKSVGPDDQVTYSHLTAEGRRPATKPVREYMDAGEKRWLPGDRNPVIRTEEGEYKDIDEEKEAEKAQQVQQAE